MDLPLVSTAYFSLYSIPLLGDSIETDCGQAGQAFSVFTASETLNPSSVSVDICATVTKVTV